MEEKNLNTEDEKIRDYVFKASWKPQHRTAAIVRLERLERAVARHEETLSRINTLLDMATSARYPDDVAPRAGA